MTDREECRLTAIFDSLSEPIARRVTAGLTKIALGLLRDAPGGMGLRALARLLGVSPPTVSEAVNTLVGKHLVIKAPGADKRSINLVLTQAGEALADQTREWPGFLADAVDTLDPVEQAALLRPLVKVVRALQQADDVPLQRMCVTCTYFRPNVHGDAANPHHCAYVDAPFGDRHLRLACPEHAPASAAEQEQAWRHFAPLLAPRGNDEIVAEQRSNSA